MKTNILLIFTVVLGLTSCQKSSNYYKCSGPTQGTMFNITYESSDDLCPEIDSLLKDFELTFSNYNPKSLISRVNNNIVQKVNDDFLYFYYASDEVYNNTNGAFDITVAPIANMLGFGYEKIENVIIDTAAIKETLQYVDFMKTSIKNKKVYKEDPNIRFISNAIAQGYAVDVMANFLNSKNIENYIVEIGGEVYAQGISPDGDSWELGIDKPIEGSGYEDRESQTKIKINNKAVATSGNYRKFLKIEDTAFGHSIDPRTGFPVKNSLLSVTVIADECIYADAYATSFMVLGLNESKKCIKHLENIEALFIYKDENGNIATYETENFRN